MLSKSLMDQSIDQNEWKQGIMYYIMLERYVKIGSLVTPAMENIHINCGFSMPFCVRFFVFGGHKFLQKSSFFPALPMTQSGRWTEMNGD